MLNVFWVILMHREEEDDISRKRVGQFFILAVGENYDKSYFLSFTGRRCRNLRYKQNEV